jgi:RNA polymerase sigma factor (sigma-70 family)
MGKVKGPGDLGKLSEKADPPQVESSTEAGAESGLGPSSVAGNSEADTTDVSVEAMEAAWVILEPFYEEYRDLMRRVIQCITYNPAEAEERVQDVFLNVCRALAKRNREDPGHVLALLIRAAKNKGIDFDRLKKPDSFDAAAADDGGGGKRNRAANVPATGPSPEDRLLARESADLAAESVYEVRKCVQQLESPWREVLDAYFKGVENQVISRNLGLTRSRVSILKGEAQEKVRACLKRRKLAREIADAMSPAPSQQ